MSPGKLVIIVALLLMLVIGCSSEGDKAKNNDAGTASYLAAEYPAISVNRISEARTFVGQALWEYINGGAELYHLYNFIEVATADYKNEQIEIVTDIYKFDSPENAYGLYSQIRQQDNTLLKLGVEGFAAPGTVNFIKGQYMVRVVGYTQSQESDLTIINLAQKLEQAIPGSKELPTIFGKLPEGDVIQGTRKYYAESFLGHKFLIGFYSQDYGSPDNMQTCFVSDDSIGNKYLQWSELAYQAGKFKELGDNPGFDENYGFIFIDNYYGEIMIGLKSGYIIGMINYSPKQKSLLTEWLSGI